MAHKGLGRLLQALDIQQRWKLSKTSNNNARCNSSRRNGLIMRQKHYTSGLPSEVNLNPLDRGCRPAAVWRRKQVKYGGHNFVSQQVKPN